MSSSKLPRAFLSTSSRPAFRKMCEKFRCPTCATKLRVHDVVCESCGALRPVEASHMYGANPWLAFESTSGTSMLRFDVDVDKLHAEYRKKMKELHPDRRASEQLEIANHHSSMVKSAYDILSNPLRRAEYICRLLYNVECFEENTNIEDADFMMELLTANEYIQEELLAPAQRNYSRITGDIMEFRKYWQDQYDKQIKELTDRFEKARQFPSDESNMRSAVVEEIRKNVHTGVAIVKLLDQLEQRLLELGYDIAE